jgi:hypothetical protein
MLRSLPSSETERPPKRSGGSTPVAGRLIQDRPVEFPEKPSARIEDSFQAATSPADPRGNGPCVVLRGAQWAMGATLARPGAAA